MTLSTLRNWAHDALAILGALAASQALVVNFLMVIGVNVDASRFSNIAGAIGALVVILSKAIDSNFQSYVVSQEPTPPSPALKAVSPRTSVAPPTVGSGTVTTTVAGQVLQSHPLDLLPTVPPTGG